MKPKRRQASVRGFVAVELPISALRVDRAPAEHSPGLLPLSDDARRRHAGLLGRSLRDAHPRTSNKATVARATPGNQ